MGRLLYQVVKRNQCQSKNQMTMVVYCIANKSQNVKLTPFFLLIESRCDNHAR